MENKKKKEKLWSVKLKFWLILIVDFNWQGEDTVLFHYLLMKKH